MRSPTEPAGILIISGAGIIGKIIPPLIAERPISGINFIDSSSILNINYFIKKFSEYRPALILLDITDRTDAEPIKKLLGENPGFKGVPIVEIHCHSTFEQSQILDIIKHTIKTHTNLPSVINHEVDQKEMLLIPAGHFKRRPGISPSYRIDELGNFSQGFTDAFYMDRYPVTNREYQRFIEANQYPHPPFWMGGIYPGGHDNHPVTGVNWNDVMAYAQWSGKRIPTASEWEKAAYGEDGTRYPWGDDFSSGKCNVFESNMKGTTPVGYYSPQGDSHYGISDLVGNVWEWVYNWTASEDNRMLMGGAWDTPANLLSEPNFAHLHTYPDLRGANFGFRLTTSTSIGQIRKG